MFGGHSSAVGIVFYDTSKKNENAVFCHYEENEPVFKTGEKDELLEEMKKLDKVFPRSPTGFYLKAFGLILLCFSLFVAAVWKFIGGFFPVFGAFVFSVASVFPVLILTVTVKGLYLKKDDLEQFRRFHGAEHIALTINSDENKTPSPENFPGISPLYGECGTAYAFSAIVFFALFGIFFGLIPKIGFFFFLLAVLLTAILLFFNFLKPLKPFLFFESFVVKEPSEKEILLAAKGIEILSKL